MDDVLALLAFLAGCAAIAWLGACWYENTGARRRRAEQAEKRADLSAARTATWETAEEGVPERGTFGAPGAYGVTRILVRHVTDDGEEIGRVLVVEIPNNAHDWQVRVTDARAEAANRAATLNARM